MKLKTIPFADLKPKSTGINSYAKALRYVASLSDYERLRIVRYNSQNFDLDRMRTLLKSSATRRTSSARSTSPVPRARAAPAR
jgi:hypothetical protein